MRLGAGNRILDERVNYSGLLEESRHKNLLEKTAVSLGLLLRLALASCKDTIY